MPRLLPYSHGYLLQVSRFVFVTIIVTTDQRQFILFYLFYFSFFSILFACLRFVSHFWSNDSHVTGEHMVELGGHFFLFFYNSKQFFNVHVHCICKVTSLMQVQEAVFRDENTLIRVQFVELTVEELFTKSIDVWVLRENTASTSLSFIDQIWNLLSGKAQHQVRI